jgi:hypothetical protein
MTSYKRTVEGQLARADNIGVMKLITVVVLLHLVTGSWSQHNLTFLFITSFGQFGFNSSGAIPAVDMALESINSDASVLPGYNLVHDGVRDSQVC